MKKVVLLIAVAIVYAISFEVSAKGQTAAAIYGSKCIMCHSSGVAGAPRSGKKEEWGPRLEKNVIEGLLKKAKAGFGPMPPMGTCKNCTDEELRSVIKYMSGG